MQLLFDPAIPFLGTYTKGLKARTQRDSYILMFIALFILVQVKASEVASDGQMDKHSRYEQWNIIQP